MADALNSPLLFNDHPDPLWIYDRTTLRFLAVNRAAAGACGYSVAELSKLRLTDIRPGAQLPAVRQFSARQWVRGGAEVTVDVLSQPCQYRNQTAQLELMRPAVAAALAAQGEQLAREREQRQAAEASARYFRTLFEAGPGKMLVLSPEEYRILAVSDDYLEATMSERDDLLGRHMFDVFPAIAGGPKGASVRNLRTSLDYVRSHGTAHAMPVQHYPVQRPPHLGGDFEERYWTATNTPVKGPDGKISCIIHRVEDVTAFITGSADEAVRTIEERTAHLQADILLRARELMDARAQSDSMSQQLQKTLEHMSDAFYLLDRQMRFLFLNTKALQLLQRTDAEVLGRQVWEAFPEAANTVIKPRYEEALTSGESRQLSLYYASLDRWFDIRVYPGDEGLAVYFRDITSERARQEQLRLLETAVSRQSDILQITEATNIDAPGGPRIVYVNDAFVRRTGYSREEALATTPRLLQGPKTQRSELDRIRAALERGEPVRAELINYTKCGEELWLELDIVPIVDDGGQLTHWVSVQRDVTERHLLEERLRQSQKLEAVGQLTGGIAHDFNNLLTVILGNAELLADQLGDRPALRQLAEITYTAAERGAQLTARLLAFARRQVLDPKQVDLNLLITGMDGLLRRTLTEDIEIQLLPGPGLWLAEVDPAQLESALLNLAINARDAMPDGGRLIIETGNVRFDEASVAIQPEMKPGDYVLVSVTDSGTGMSAEVAARVFEPFFTTKEVGKGSGLGLSMVYGFVRQSRGSVRIYSEPGEGTTVSLYFPCATGQADASREGGAQQPIVGGSERILVVEDNGLVRHHAIALLQGLGYLVTSASSGPQALEILQQRSDFDLLFSDIIMPGGMSGHKLAETVRQRYPGLRVLLTSGYSETAILNQGRLEAGTQLLSKPYRRQELALKIRRVLDAPPPA